MLLKNQDEYYSAELHNQRDKICNYGTIYFYTDVINYTGVTYYINVTKSTHVHKNIERTKQFIIGANAKWADE